MPPTHHRSRSPRRAGLIKGNINEERLLRRQAVTGFSPHPDPTPSPKNPKREDDARKPHKNSCGIKEPPCPELLFETFGERPGGFVHARGISDSGLPASSHIPPKRPARAHTSCSTKSSTAAESASMIPNTASNPKMHRVLRMSRPEVRIHGLKPKGPNRALFAAFRGQYINKGGALQK